MDNITIGILKEPAFENRVSLLPSQVTGFLKQDINVIVEAAAGENALASDDEYQKAGCIVSSREEVIKNAGILLSFHPLNENDLSLVKPGQILIGVFQPLYNSASVHLWAEKGITVFSLDMLPRTTRAQSMDVLSSQANIAGYKSVLLAAGVLPRYFPMFITAAGSVPPAKVLILGAGVAGLQAIATARRLGAVVEVFDTRPAVKEEVKSLGAKFIEVEGAADAAAAGGYAVEQDARYKELQHEKIAEAAKKADVIITTAQIPGKKAPVLIDEPILSGMKKGSVIIDLAAATGGNTAKTENDKTVYYNNISIIGNSNLAATMPVDASRLYGKNVTNFLGLIFSKEGKISLDFNDDLVKGCCILHAGNIMNERVNTLISES